VSERYGQVRCDVGRDESSSAQQRGVHRQYPTHVVTLRGRQRCTGWPDSSTQECFNPLLVSRSGESIK